MTHIGDKPTPEMYATGLEIECQCARCGSSCDWDECGECDDGFIDDDDDFLRRCHDCNGYGGWQTCLSSPDFCRTHPLSGREEIRRDLIEWFTVSAAAAGKLPPFTVTAKCKAVGNGVPREMGRAIAKAVAKEQTK